MTTQVTHVVQVEGRPGGKADTILGYDKLMQRFGVLVGNARQLQLARKKARRQLDELLECAKASWSNKMGNSNSNINTNCNCGSNSSGNGNG